MASQFDFSTGMYLTVAYLQVPFVLKKIEYKGLQKYINFFRNLSQWNSSGWYVSWWWSETKSSKKYIFSYAMTLASHN